MLTINMQKGLLFAITLILINIYGYSGSPTSTQKYDKGANTDDLEREQDEHGDIVTQATFLRSTSLSAPYHQMYVASTKRRSELAEERNTASASESFYPQFLRNPRHYFPNSEADRFRPITTGRAKFAADQSLLGSGDFSVLKGGTFYQGSDQYPVPVYMEFYRNGNGHQRPYASPLMQKLPDSSDPFSNFRDFADINVSNDAGQHSELYVVYASKNNTVPISKENQKPIANKINGIRNIKDQLDLIDNEQKLLKLSKKKLKIRSSKKQDLIKNTSTSESTVKISDSDSDFMLALS